MAKSTKYLEQFAKDTVTMGSVMRLKILFLLSIIVTLFTSLFVTKASFAQSNSACLISLSDISMVYNAEHDEFAGSITIGNDYFCVSEMVIRIEGEDGLQIEEKLYRPIGDQVTFQLDGSRLKAERKYFVFAIPLNDQSEIFTTEDGPIQQKKEFFYHPKGPDPLTVRILSVNPDHASGKLIIDLDISNEERVASYEGFITDMDSGGSIHTIDAQLYKTMRIEEPLAANNVIRTSLEPKEYRLNLCLNTKDDNQVCAEPYEFKPAPAPQKTSVEKILGALNNPWVAGSVLIVLMSAIGWVIIRNSRSSKSEPGLRRPPIGGTDTIASAGRSAGGRGRTGGALYIQVLRAPGSANLKKQKISRFPYTIGREGCSLNINDPHISKPHVEINERDGSFYLKDLNSTNHTYVNDREIPANKSVQIRDVTLLRLGPNTEVELEPAE